MSAPPLWQITVEQADRTITNAGAIATAVAFGTASDVQRLEQPVGVATGEAFGQVAKAVRVLGGVGIGSGQAFGTPSIALRDSPVGVASQQAWGTPGVQRLEQPVGLASAAAVAAPSLLLSTVVSAQGIATGENFGTATLVAPAAAVVGGQSGFPFPLFRPRRTPQPVRRLVLAVAGIPSRALVASPKLRLSAAPPAPPDYDPDVLLALRRIGRRQRRKIPVMGVAGQAAAGTPGVWQLRPPPPIIERVRATASPAEDEELLLLELV